MLLRFMKNYSQVNPLNDEVFLISRFMAQNIEFCAIFYRTLARFMQQGGV